MAKISVIVPVYKVEPYLQKCIDSILSQGFQDFDLVLVDDGSPDNCPQLCDACAAADPRIKVLHKENGGLSDARNAGIDWAMEHSDSEWLAFVDSDDFIHPDYLQSLYETALKESADLVICDFSRVDDAGSSIENSHSFFDLTTSDKRELFGCLAKNWRLVPAWNKLYAKSIFEHLRFEYRKIHEDEYAIHHVLWICKKAAIISKALYYYRCRPNSIMSGESAASKLDGLEAGILQYEFCLEHGLPPVRSLVNTEYLNSVIDLRKGLTQQEAARYRALKRRYSGIFFSAEKNHSVKGYSMYYLNGAYRMAQTANRVFRRKKGGKT